MDEATLAKGGAGASKKASGTGNSRKRQLEKDDSSPRAAGSKKESSRASKKTKPGNPSELDEDNRADAQISIIFAICDLKLAILEDETAWNDARTSGQLSEMVSKVSSTSTWRAKLIESLRDVRDGQDPEEYMLKRVEELAGVGTYFPVHPCLSC
jgi:hypothetical protein